MYIKIIANISVGTRAKLALPDAPIIHESEKYISMPIPILLMRSSIYIQGMMFEEAFL
jgi:hypothetical protein